MTDPLQQVGMAISMEDAVVLIIQDLLYLNSCEDHNSERAKLPLWKRATADH